jgi:predicted RNA-binding Zn-ribbon protein involved in translation (DUF1610 family)
MAEPEIARRCPSCGASFREQAFFCPQCGKEIKGHKEIRNKSDVRDISDARDTQEIIINDGATLTEADFQALQKPPSAPANKPPAVNKVGVEKRKTPANQKARGVVGAHIQRATTRARDVEGNVVHRVQKFREISSVVIDEAGYDPSLRFVLVAAALFGLFLIIVLLNKLI